MGKFNFRSVGKTTSDIQTQTLTPTPTPLGIKTPLREGTQEGIFAMTYTLSDQVGYNLVDLIKTNWGERVGFYDFGANLRPILSEYVSQESFDAQAVERISGAVKRWMPYVSLKDYISELDRVESSGTSVIKIKITYDIPALNVFNKAVQVILYVL